MRIIPRLISFAFLLSLVLPTEAQNCGCADNSNCPLQFPSNTSTQVCYNFTDAFNNNLASPTQGVCGVYIKFRHGRIGDLELTLTSPAGQQVQLIGTSGSCNTFTPLATWDILFVPCATACQPDTVGTCYYPCNFDGCPISCPWGSGTYDGQYHPFSGCLESFNTGPANGLWCIDIANNATFNGGTILDFEVILCDESGILCCDADAGNLPDPNVNACIGEAALDLDLDPVYGAIVPDPAEYGYTFAVFRGGNLYDLDTTDNFTTYPAGSYTICGLSYLLADAAGLPTVGTPLTPQSLDDNLTGPSPNFCGNIGLNCVVVNIGVPPPTTMLLDTICDGQSVVFDGQNIGVPGSYSDTLTSYFGCDSVVNLQLTVMPNVTTSLTETICFGDTLWVGGNPYTTTGSYTEDLFTAFSCDSTVTLNLTVLPENTTTLSEVICEGETFSIGSTAYSTTGVYEDTLLSWQGCDSTVTLNLTVVQTSVSIATPDTITCQQTQVALTSTSSTSFGTLAYQWTTVGGAFGGPTDQPNATATASGTYTLTVSAAGCSSSATVTVEQDAQIPSAVISPSANLLTCATTSITLDASGSMPVGNFTWVWSAQAGSTIANASTLNATITQPDTYRIIITDLTNACKDTATVVITQNIVPPVANAGADMELSCTVPTVSLSGATSTPSGGVSFAWSTTDGHLLPPTNAATATADDPGTYRLIVEDLANACRDTDLVVVTVDTLTPSADIALPQGDMLNCYHDTLTLDGTGSTGSQFIVYQWIGNVFDEQGTPTAHVNSPGVYTLVLTDTANGCTDSTSVTIGTDFAPPIADAGPDDLLTCTVISVQIGGSGTSTGPDFNHEWTSSPDGSFLSATNLPTVNVNSEGIYYLTVTDTTNGCTSSDFTIIEYNETPPVADAGPDYVLNCTDLSFTLDASGSTIVPLATFKWTNSSGTVISNDVQVVVDYADTFIFEIAFAFCASYDTVVVAEGTVAPVADAGPDQLIDCLTGQTTLDGSGSTSAVGIDYLWTALSGHVFSGEMTQTPTVDDPGEYVLQVTNTNNGCFSMDTVLVTLVDANCTPFANAGADGLINCYDLTFSDTLTASATTGTNLSYVWTAISGNILNQTDPFAPIVTAGEFVLTVTNNAVGLMASDTVIVVSDTILPVAEAGPNILSLTCPELAACFPLDPTGSSVGAQYAYLWEAGQTGALCTVPTLLNAEVLGEDVYTLTISNLLNGCQSDDAVLVQLLDFPSYADAGPDFQIPCGDTSAVLNGTNSSIDGTTYSYEWTSVGGDIVANNQTLTPEVVPNNPNDTFTLIVTNNLNACRDTDEVVIFAPINCNPDCAASASGVLDCDNDTVSLLSTGSSVGSDISYLWATMNGNFCGGQTTATACADAPGIYELTVSRTYPSGAAFTTTCQVQVFDNSQPPTADAGPNDDLNCVDHQLTIGGNSSSGNNFTYLWTAPIGHFCSGVTGATTCVDAPGTYHLLVTDTSNGCTATDFMEVGVDTLHPVANAGPDGMLTCNNNTAVLTGSATPTNVTYSWVATTGDICAGEMTPSPVICDAGTYILTVTIAANGCTDTDIANVSVDPDVPNPEAGPDLDYTCSDTVFTINASVTGNGVLDFQWTATNGGCFIGPDDVLQAMVGCPGTYTLTVTNLLTGCSGVSQMVVNDITTPPDLHLLSPPEINCQNLTVALDASGSLPTGQLSFLWMTIDGHIISGQGTANPQVDSAGTYTVVATNLQTHCTASASVTVFRDAAIPTAIAGTDTTLTCTRNSLLLSGLGSSMGSGIVYEWTTMDGHIVSGETTLMPEIDKSGTYILRVEDTDNNCTVSDQVTVTMDTLQPTATIDASQTLTITCATQQVTILGDGSSPLDTLDFHWETVEGQIFIGENNPNVTVTKTGIYLLTVTNQRNGCTDTASVEVLENLVPPILSFAAAPVLTCDLPSAQLSVLPDTPGYGYLWAGPGSILDITTATPTISQSGVFSVTVTDLANGCQHDSTIVVSENFQVPLAAATSIGKLDCQNLTATVSGEGSTATGASYQWTTVGPGVIATPDSLTTVVDAPGWYFILVKNLSNGCMALDSTFVIASAQPIDNVLLTLEHPDCLDPEGYVYIDSVIGGSAPYFYSIDGDVFITYPQFSYLDEGNHTLVVKDENGCSWADTLTLFGPGELLVELGPDVTIKQGETFVLEAQISIPMTEVDTIWWTNLPDSIECPQCLTQVVAPDETTTYRVHVIDTNGCAAMDQVTVVVTEDNSFYVPTAFSPNGDGTNDLLFLYAGPEIVQIRAFSIFDRWGNLVFYEEKFTPNSPQFGWDGRFENQPVDPAVFVWVAELEFVNGSTKEFHGDLTLVR